MDRESIRLLHWLRLRSFVNWLGFYLSKRLVIAAVNLYAFLGTWLVMFLLWGLNTVEPIVDVSPLLLELAGVVFFLLLAVALATYASSALSLSTHEEDILLTMPVESRTIIQSRLIRALALAPFLALLTSSVTLGGIAAFVRIDYVAHLLGAYLATLFFFFICMGAFWTLGGALKRHPKAGLIENALGSIAFAVFLLLLLAIWFYGLAVLEVVYAHPVTRLLLAIPLVSTDLFLHGDASLNTLVETLVLAGLAAVLLTAAFRLRYELAEEEISPYRRTMGRGAERESPPLPELLLKVRRVLHIDYYDAGEGARALFGMSYSLSLSWAIWLGILMGPLVLFLSSSWKDAGHVSSFNLVFWGPMLVTFSWFIGAVLASAASQKQNPDIIRSVPVEGRTALLSVILPGLLLLGVCYFSSLVLALVVLPLNPTLVLLEGFILAPVPFVSAYVITFSASMSSRTMEWKMAPEGAEPSPGLLIPLFTRLLVYMLPWGAFLAYWIYTMSDVRILLGFDPRASVLFVLLYVSVGMTLAYHLYGKGARDFDALGPEPHST